MKAHTTQLSLPAPAPREPTLTQALLAAGYTHRPGGFYSKDIIRISDGVVVGRMKASEAWEWLESHRDIKPENVTGGSS